MSEWLNKLWHRYTVEYEWTVEKAIDARNNLSRPKGIMLSEKKVHIKRSYTAWSHLQNILKMTKWQK